MVLVHHTSPQCDLSVYDVQTDRQTDRVNPVHPPKLPLWRYNESGRKLSKLKRGANDIQERQMTHNNLSKSQL